MNGVESPEFAEEFVEDGAASQGSVEAVRRECSLLKLVTSF